MAGRASRRRARLSSCESEEGVIGILSVCGTIKGFCTALFLSNSAGKTEVIGHLSCTNNGQEDEMPYVALEWDHHIGRPMISWLVVKCKSVGRKFGGPQAMAPRRDIAYFCNAE